MSEEILDVLIVGSGISGIGAGAHLSMKCPNKKYLIPGYLNKSQVPPKLSLPSRIRYFLLGHFMLK